MGTACASELARRGLSVTVLERDRVGHGVMNWAFTTADDQVERIEAEN